MNIILKLRTSCLILILSAFIAKANDETLGSPNSVANIPANSWEQHPQGVAVALNLADWTDDGGRHLYGIKIYIKNTSSADKYLMDMGADFGIQMIYVNAQDSPTLLHNVDLLHRTVMAVVPPALIKPGQSLVSTIWLGKNELDLLKSHPVKCIFFISNQGLHLDLDERNKVETFPKRLVIRFFKRYETPW